MKIYVSGPMTGVKDHNYPLFNTVAGYLRKYGYEVLNPAELPEPGNPGSQPWSWYLRRDLQEMLNCDAIVLLPNWRNSQGAQLECDVASRVGMSLFEINIEDYKLTELLEKQVV